MPPEALSGPTVTALLALFDNYVEDARVTETITAEERAENDAFLDAIMATTVMQRAHAFLVGKGEYKAKVC